MLICTHVRELFEDEAWEHGDDQYYEIAQELSSQIQNLYHIEPVSYTHLMDKPEAPCSIAGSSSPLAIV